LENKNNVNLVELNLERFRDNNLVVILHLLFSSDVTFELIKKQNMVDPDVYLFVDCFVLLCCFVPAKKNTFTDCQQQMTFLYYLIMTLSLGIFRRHFKSFWF